MTKVEKYVTDVARDAIGDVRNRRDNAQNAMRDLSAGLVEMRVAARALAAIDTSDNEIPAEAGKLDDEVKAIVAELAGLFADETVAVEESIPMHTIDGRVATAERLIDLAGRQIAQRFPRRPGLTGEAMNAWLSLLERSIRDHYAEQEEGL